MELTKINLNGVQETLLMPLWGRAYETKKSCPLLIDNEAVRIMEMIDYNFDQIAQKTNPLSRVSWISRSIYFDNKITEFLSNNPNGSIINIGCGLDTTYDRINNGKGKWYELDFPDVIEIRKQVLTETKNRIFLPYSVFDNQWYYKIENTDNVLILLAGVIYYFEEDQVKALLKTFGEKFKNALLIFDYSSIKGMEIANKKVIENTGMDKTAYLKWGINNIRTIEKWQNGIRIRENMKMFKEMKKRYPFSKRIGMIISDFLSIMSLTAVTIEKSV